MTGREREVKELKRLYHSDRAELVAIYGRRRVGKTFLVNEVFDGSFAFKHAGLSPIDNNKKGLLRAQLDTFYYSLILYGMEEDHRPESWLEAFFMLEKLLQEKDDGSKQVVFLDELPWLDTPRSGFLTAFEWFWNGWGCSRKNLLVIVCGSANSWILDKLINNHGGLYNRVTWEIQLSPFSLHECEVFFQSAGIHFSRYDIARCYMTVGGIPYYLQYFEDGFSFAQNVDRLFFERKAKLREEFDRLFASVFDNPESIKKIVRVLNARSIGFTRKELTEQAGIIGNGQLTENLNALIASDFVEQYIPFGDGKREERYKLVDPFCRFYLRFVEGNRNAGHDYWVLNQESQPVVSWNGFAFEALCFRHVDQIKQALGISAVRTAHSAWIKPGTEEESGAQVDMVLERADNVLNACEIKFYKKPFALDKSDYETVLHRQALLEKKCPPRMSVQNTLISTFGVSMNAYGKVFSRVLTLDDLFA